MQITKWGEPLELYTSDTPAPSGAEVLVRIEACGVCHSDLHIWEGFFDLGNGQKFAIEDRGVHLPFILGHEPVGTVIAKGENAGDVDEGRSYVIYPWINCGDCEPCRNGLTQVCDAPQIIGTRVNGAYADHVVVPNADYLVDHDGISPDLACTLACAGLTAYSALKKIIPETLTARDTLLIIGAGGVGLTAICIARALSRARILVADIDMEKRDVALSLGADDVIDPAADDAAERLQSLSHRDTGNGIAASIDFVGLPQTMSLGVACLRKGGQHVHVGLFGGAYQLSLPPLAFRMLRICGSYVGTLAEFRELVALAKGGLEMPIPINPRPLEEASQALAELRAGEVVGRIVLKP